MYCIECGQAQPVRDARFCPFCGTSLYKPAADAVPLEPVPPGKAVSSETQSLQAGADTPSGSERGDVQPGSDAPPAAATGSTPPALRPIAPAPLDAALPVALNPARWVPLNSRAEQLRTRLRWALRAGVVLAVILGGAGAWWWVSTTQEVPPEDGVEVERVEGAPKQPS